MTGFYYLGSRYYDPVIGRFINPDTTDVLTANPTAMTDKNLYAYCDNNPVMRVDKDGNIWELALASGETMALGSGSAIVAGLSAAAPVAIGVAITVVVVVGVSAAIKFAKSKSKKKLKKKWIHMRDLDRKNKEEKLKLKVGEAKNLNPEITEGIISQHSRKAIHLQEKDIRNITLN